MNLANRTMTPAEIDPRQVIGWAREAGQIAMKYFNRQKKVWHKPNNTFVTEADLEMEALLAERIKAAFPDDGLIGEEGARSQKGQGSKRIWAIDPLDGTTLFVKGLPGWGILIGALEDGQPSFGCFYMPLLDDLSYTYGSTGVCWNGNDISGAIRSDWRDKGFLAISSSVYNKFEINIRCTRSVGGVGANLAYTARGTATAGFFTKARLWDLVAGAAIVKRAGGELRYLSGQPIDYLELLDGRLAREPIIVGHPELLGELSEKIKRKKD
jgi:myo-inositol-1(or 4)-monophosphatase